MNPIVRKGNSYRLLFRKKHLRDKTFCSDNKALIETYGKRPFSSEGKKALRALKKKAPSNPKNQLSKLVLGPAQKQRSTTLSFKNSIKEWVTTVYETRTGLDIFKEYKNREEVAQETVFHYIRVCSQVASMVQANSNKCTELSSFLNQTLLELSHKADKAIDDDIKKSVAAAILNLGNNELGSHLEQNMTTICRVIIVLKKWCITELQRQAKLSMGKEVTSPTEDAPKNQNRVSISDDETATVASSAEDQPTHSAFHLNETLVVNMASADERSIAGSPSYTINEIHATDMARAPERSLPSTTAGSPSCEVSEKHAADMARASERSSPSMTGSPSYAMNEKCVTHSTRNILLVTNTDHHKPSEGSSSGYRNAVAVQHGDSINKTKIEGDSSNSPKRDSAHPLKRQQPDQANNQYCGPKRHKLEHSAQELQRPARNKLFDLVTQSLDPDWAKVVDLDAFIRRMSEAESKQVLRKFLDLSQRNEKVGKYFVDHLHLA